MSPNRKKMSKFVFVEKIRRKIRRLSSNTFPPLILQAKKANLSHNLLVSVEK